MCNLEFLEQIGVVSQLLRKFCIGWLFKEVFMSPGAFAHLHSSPSFCLQIVPSSMKHVHFCSPMPVFSVFHAPGKSFSLNIAFCAWTRTSAMLHQAKRSSCDKRSRLMVRVSLMRYVLCCAVLRSCVIVTKACF